MQQIIALGGGFSMLPDDLLLGEYVLSQVNTPRPKVCYLPQAGGESRDFIVRFYDAFVRLGAQPSWFSLFGRVDANWPEQLLSQDILYVGGGNTRSLLALWRGWGVDGVLREALARGIVLAGISAGAICWFEQSVTDSVWPLGVLDGFGFLAGSCCPHYDSEPERRPAYQQFIAEQKVLPGLALDDHVAAHFVDGMLEHIVAAKSGAAAYRVTVENGAAVEHPLAATVLG
ncbi:MAG: type 1 glutamine amidotransferase-like domain-containing protein [Chloroflexi bacterium]|nr:type 1 glutamine amidotransferase-like domain-containing protein [Chloroflexota bacterium]